MNDDHNLILVDDTPDPLLWVSEPQMAALLMWPKLQLVMGLFVGAFAGAFFVFVLPCLFLDACRMVGFGWGSGAMMVVAGTFGMRARANGLKLRDYIKATQRAAATKPCPSCRGGRDYQIVAACVMCHGTGIVPA